jgi:hypothetical protein
MRKHATKPEGKPIWVYLRSQGPLTGGPAWLRKLNLQVYAAYTEDDSVMLTVKAASREAAKSKLWMINPQLRFFK